ncbi:zona pellucida sperm-binding protein 4-like [Neoarius graeffei]|uniref:zona pellucida sperm-binding protein 4-like n=1 Tax=Neoarius graeffei TaxID=443677 RepID=UPI00298C8F32|nr:zona pellucida sperm-binding protein 4-like [Neoarius graeffei]
MLRAQMRFATDSSFRSFYKIQAHPVMHTLGDPVFVEVFVLKHEDKDLELVLNECWATSSPDPHDELRWNLLHKGCPRQDDDYKVEVLEVRPGDIVKYPKLHKWLKITMFSFVESEDLYDSIYLHCDAEVCKGARCLRTCNRKRRQSGVQRILNEGLVIRGGALILGM